MSDLKVLKARVDAATRLSAKDLAWHAQGDHKVGYGDIVALLAHIAAQAKQIAAKDAEIERLKAILSELVTTVRGEAPRLLNEDSGGNAKLSMDIDDALTPQPKDHSHV